MNYRKGELAGNAMLYIIFFLIVSIMFIGFWVGYSIYFGQEYDFRQREANTLIRLSKECIERENFFANIPDKKMFLEKCGFSSKVVEDGNHMIYFNSSQGEFYTGVISFQDECFFEARRGNLDYPLCAEFKSEKGYLLVGSSQNERRISL